MRSNRCMRERRVSIVMDSDDWALWLGPLALSLWLFVALNCFFLSLSDWIASRKMYFFFAAASCWCPSPLSFSFLVPSFSCSRPVERPPLTAETNLTIHALWPQLHGPVVFARMVVQSIASLLVALAGRSLWAVFLFFLFAFLWEAASWGRPTLGARPSDYIVKESQVSYICGRRWTGIYKEMSGSFLLLCLYFMLDHFITDVSLESRRDGQPPPVRSN